MKCIICATDYDCGIYQGVLNFPYLLCKIGDKTKLDILIEKIDRCGLVSEYLIVTNNKFFNYFNQWAENTNYNVNLINNGTSSVHTALGVVRDVKLAINRTKISEDIFVIRGNSNVEADLSNFIIDASRHRTSCIAIYNCINYSSGDVLVSLDGDGNVKSISKTNEYLWDAVCCPDFLYLTAVDAMYISKNLQFGCGVDNLLEIPLWMHNVKKLRSVTLN